MSTNLRVRPCIKPVLALGALLATSGCVAMAALWPDPHPGKALPTHPPDSPAPEPSGALRWIDPERQHEGHTCGLHAASVLYGSYGLDTGEFRLRERLGIDVPAVKLMESSTGMLPTDLLRVLGEDGFHYEMLPPESEGAAAKLRSHLVGHMALCVVPLGGFELHWIAARPDRKGAPVLLDSLGGRVRAVDLEEFVRDTALSIVLVRPRAEGEPAPENPHGTGAKEMGRIWGRK